MKRSGNIAQGILIILGIILGLSSFSFAATHAVVLQYHHFGEDTPRITSVTLDHFEQHLTYLQENEYTVWSLERIIAYLREKRELPEKCVAITIDDAFVSVYEEAYPRLKELGYPFTIFVPTEAIERRMGSYMTWDQMREMKDADVTFSPHSHTHNFLNRRLPGESEAGWVERITKDIQTSMDLLQEKLGSTSKIFAYPYGEYNNDLRQIVLSLGLTGFGQHSGAIWHGSDFTALTRFPMAADYAELSQFKTKVRSLPLPVITESPVDPTIPQGVEVPVLRLELAPGEYVKDSLACYSGGQGKIQLRWIDKEKGIAEVTANEPLGKGRSRYNCTAVHKKGGRYFWYSHLWIRN